MLKQKKSLIKAIKEDNNFVEAYIHAWRCIYIMKIKQSWQLRVIRKE